MQKQSVTGLVSWQQVPMVWMLVAIPLSSVVVGMIMLWFAIESYDGLVVDDYHQHSKQINRTLARDTVAANHGIGADLELMPQSGILTVRLSLRKSLPLPDTLLLRFIHRTRAGEDILVTLQKTGNLKYSAPLPALASSNWRVQLESNDWRINGLAPVPGKNLFRLSAQ
jgi:hypothetical protein